MGRGHARYPGLRHSPEEVDARDMSMARNDFDNWFVVQRGRVAHLHGQRITMVVGVDTERGVGRVGDETSRADHGEHGAGKEGPHLFDCRTGDVRCHRLHVEDGGLAIGEVDQHGAVRSNGITAKPAADSKVVNRMLRSGSGPYHSDTCCSSGGHGRRRPFTDRSSRRQQSAVEVGCQQPDTHTSMMPSGGAARCTR